MKKIIFLMFFMASISNAQFNYQSILKDNGIIVSNTPVKIKISFIYDSTSGALVYTETHPITTSPDGVINLEIGSGTVDFGTFSSIDLSRVIYVKREIDINNSGTFTDFGTSLLNSVPKANYSQRTANLEVNNTAYTIGIGSNSVSSTYSIAIGQSALTSNTLGSSNIAIGFEALNLNTAGGDNVAVGKQALKNSTGSSSTNTGFGNYSLYNLTGGSNNTAIGRSAGINNETGSNNTYLGFGSKNESGINTSNSTAIGANATLSSSNTIQLGDSNVTLVNTSGTVSASAFVGDGSGLTNLSLSLNSNQNFSNGNTAVGPNALISIDESSELAIDSNTAIGSRALEISTVDRNTAVGSHASGYNVTGRYNTTLGIAAARDATNINGIVAIGDSAMRAQTNSGTLSDGTYSRNTAVGYHSMTGNDNVAI